MQMRITNQSDDSITLTLSALSKYVATFMLTFGVLLLLVAVLVILDEPSNLSYYIFLCFILFMTGSGMIVRDRYYYWPKTIVFDKAQAKVIFSGHSQNRQDQYFVAYSQIKGCEVAVLSSRRGRSTSFELQLRLHNHNRWPLAQSISRKKLQSMADLISKYINFNEGPEDNQTFFLQENRTLPSGIVESFRDGQYMFEWHLSPGLRQSLPGLILISGFIGGILGIVISSHSLSSLIAIGAFGSIVLAVMLYWIWRSAFAKGQLILGQRDVVYQEIRAWNPQKAKEHHRLPVAELKAIVADQLGKNTFYIRFLSTDQLAKFDSLRNGKLDVTQTVSTIKFLLSIFNIQPPRLNFIELINFASYIEGRILLVNERMKSF